MRILLVHQPVQLPRSQAPRGPFINIMPAGLLALADRLDRAGHEVEVLHAGVEKRLDGAFDLAGEICRTAPDLLGLTLHWHQQLGPVGTLLAALRDRTPDLKVVLGGMTASAFARDLLDTWPAAGYVIRGEAEEPLRALAEELQSDPPRLERVPNLTWRSGGEIRENPLSWVADQDTLDDLAFARLELLRHAEAYNGQFAESARGFDHAPVFSLAVGRGCTVDCAFCSGGRSGQGRLTGRQRVVFRRPRRVVEDLQRLTAQGIDTVSICFDPPGAGEPYHLQLFEAIRAKGLRLAAIFECFVPPSAAFLVAFSQTFDRARSRISFSPTVFDETLRGRLLGKSYPNSDLERSLQTCRDLSLSTTLYFVLVPGESRAMLDASLAWQRALQREFNCRLICAPLEMEPGAPWSCDPERYGLSAVRQGLKAYVQRHLEAPALGVSYAREVGYRFADLDSRAVHVASALADPRAAFAEAQVFCGQDRTSRSLLVGPRRLDQALALAARWRGAPLHVVYHPADGDPRDDSFRQTAAQALGPHARLLPFDAEAARHQRWNGRTAPHTPAGSLLLLHLRDEDAAWNLLLQRDRLRLPSGTVLVEACRWQAAPCPALRPGLLAVGHDGAVRCCPSSSPLPAESLGALRAALAARAAAVHEERGCATCSFGPACSRCLFTGPLRPRTFCDIRRGLGPAGLAAHALMTLDPVGGVAIGWDE